MPKGDYPHPRHVRAGDECLRCGYAVARDLFAVSVVRYYNKPDGRRGGRSLGPARICKSCAIEMLRTPAPRGPLDPDVLEEARAAG